MRATPRIGLLMYACLVLLIATAVSATAQMADQQTILAHMQALLRDAQSDALTASARSSITVIDHAIGYSYSEREGLQPWVGVVPDTNGVVTRPDGGRMMVSPETAELLGLTGADTGGVGTLDALYKPFRRVMSRHVSKDTMTAYHSIEASVALPVGVTGVNEPSGEAAYNYLGMGTFYVQPPRAMEWGVYTDGPAQTSDKAWHLYDNFSGSFHYPDRDAFSIPEGTTVFLKVDVPVAQEVVMTASYPGTSMTQHHYNVSWAGSGSVRWRRVTSLCVNSAATSKVNHWTDVKLNGSILFSQNELYSEQPWPAANVFVDKVTPYSDEIVCICLWP